MPPSDTATQGTPLAPSVEKAYYRKCIELKRRLNEVEAANDEAKTRRIRLDRAIMKMRLERAFLLEQLSRRMEVNVDGSEGSGDEGMATEPPPERPHRDKRRPPERPLAPQHHSSHSLSQQQQPQPQQQQQQQQRPSPSHTMQSYPLASLQRLPSNPTHAGPSGEIRSLLPAGPNGELLPANAITPDGQLIYLPPAELAVLPSQHAVMPPAVYGAGAPPHGSPYGATVGVPGATAPHAAPNGHLGFDGVGDEVSPSYSSINRAEHVMGEALSAVPMMREEANGERQVISDTNAAPGMDQMDATRAPGGGGFNAINQ